MGLTDQFVKAALTRKNFNKLLSDTRNNYVQICRSGVPNIFAARGPVAERGRTGTEERGGKLLRLVSVWDWKSVRLELTCLF